MNDPVFGGDLDPFAYAQMAAEGPARILALPDRGTIALGQRADLILLDRELNLKAVFVGGRASYAFGKTGSSFDGASARSASETSRRSSTASGSPLSAATTVSSRRASRRSTPWVQSSTGQGSPPMASATLQFPFLDVTTAQAAGVSPFFGGVQMYCYNCWLSRRGPRPT